MSRRLRVAVTSWGSQSPKELYRPLKDSVEVVKWREDIWYRTEDLLPLLKDIDAVHLNWPENSFGLTPARHTAASDAMQRAGVPVIWTAHDAIPHNFDLADHSDIYQVWAESVSGVLHQSHWAHSEMTRRYRFKPSTRHRVFYHPPWRRKDLIKGEPAREAAERAFGLKPGKLRVGIHGAPRPAKDVQLALDAFAACTRSDKELFVTCLDGETVPDDARIVAYPYEYMPSERFDLMLQAVDVFLLPFYEGFSTVTTGLPFDALALDKPMIVSDFPYFAEVLGDAPIVYGSTREDLTRCLEGLDDRALALATERTIALKQRHTWRDAAAVALELLNGVLEPSSPS